MFKTHEGQNAGEGVPSGNPGVMEMNTTDQSAHADLGASEAEARVPNAGAEASLVPGAKAFPKAEVAGASGFQPACTIS